MPPWEMGRVTVSVRSDHCLLLDPTCVPVCPVRVPAPPVSRCLVCVPAPPVNFATELFLFGKVPIYFFSGPPRVSVFVTCHGGDTSQSRTKPMGCGASTSAGQNLGRTSKIYSHGDEVIIQRFESHDLAGSKLKIRQDNYGSPKKQYDIERAIFCAELCNHVYLGDSIWASARSQRLKTIRDSKSFSFPCRVNLGYYASDGNNLKGLCSGSSSSDPSLTAATSPMTGRLPSVTVT